MDYKEIGILEVGDIKIGNAQNKEAGTGVTVIMGPKEGAPTGMIVMGGGPASRDSTLVDPLTTVETLNAVVFAGGSAFGLDAAGGVMKYLEEKGIGYDTGIVKVPLVAQSGLFDLKVGDSMIRPDAKMGYDACIDAETSNEKQYYGSIGAGTGASVGSAVGMDHAMKTGLGTYAVQIGDLKIGALVIVNAFGDIYHNESGQKLVGILNEDKTDLADTVKLLTRYIRGNKNLFVGNTTLGCIVTNAKFDKVKMTKVARMAHNGYARVIRPVNTTADGDTVYAMSVGDVEVNIDSLGTAAAAVMARAINEAVIHQDSEYGLMGYKELVKIKEKNNG